MMSAALYEQLPSKPRIYSFENAAPDIVGVGGASAAVKGYIDVPLRIADIEVAHPLLVVDNLSFSLLIGMDILDPHAANISLGGTREVQLEARVCDVCLEPRIPAKHEFITAPAVACTVEPMSIAANSAVIVRVALPKSARNASSVAIEPLNSSADERRVCRATRCLRPTRWFLSHRSSQPVPPPDRSAFRFSDRLREARNPIAERSSRRRTRPSTLSRRETSQRSSAN